jgi:hypothetical protein
MDGAFARLRGYARHHNLRLTDIARQIVTADLAADVLDLPTTAQSTPKRR